MRGELIYTSAPQGVRPGTSGFCTVGVTRGLPRREQQRLESLSGYDFLYGLSDPRAASNPTAFLHTRIEVGGVPHDVLSRVGFAGADHTGRSNKLAHHHLLDPQDKVRAGPAAALQALAAAEQFMPAWAGTPAERDPPSLGTPLAKANSPKGAPTWAAVAGDAGWAGALVRAFKESPKTPGIVVVRPETDVLALFTESLSILPEGERWEVCFTTYFTGSLPPDVSCHWRGVVEGTPAAEQARRLAGAMVIDLTRPPGPPKEDRYTDAARAGRMLAAVQLAKTEQENKPTKMPKAAPRDAVPQPALQVVLELSEETYPGTRFRFAEIERSGPSFPSGSRRDVSPAWLYFGLAAAIVAISIWVAWPQDRPPPSGKERGSSPSSAPTAPDRAAMSSVLPVAGASEEASAEPLSAIGTVSDAVSVDVPARPIATEATVTSSESSVPADERRSSSTQPVPPVRMSPKVLVQEPVPLHDICLISTKTATLLAGSSGDLAWVVSRSAGDITIVNRLGKFVRFDEVQEGPVRISFRKRGAWTTIGEIFVEPHGEGEVRVRRRARVSDDQLSRVLDLLPVELRREGLAPLLLVPATEPMPSEVVVHYQEGEGLTVQGPEGKATPWAKTRVLPASPQFAQPEGPGDSMGTTLEGENYPAWRILECPGPKDAYPDEERVAKQGEPAWTFRGDGPNAKGQHWLTAAVLLQPRAVATLLKVIKKGDPEDARRECEYRIEGRRIRWVDNWGVVRAQVTLRWAQKER